MSAGDDERSASQLGIDFEKALKASCPKEWWVTKMKGAVPPPRFGGGFTPKVDYDLEIKIPLVSTEGDRLGGFFVVAIECKSTSQERLRATMLLPHQRIGLKKAQSFGGLAFVAVEFRAPEGESIVVLLDPGAFPETGSLHGRDALHRGVQVPAAGPGRWALGEVLRRFLPEGSRYAWTSRA